MGKRGRLALVVTVVVALVAAGCGGDDEQGEDEQTTVDLTGQISVEDLSDEIPVTEKALEAAIAENLQERAPSDVNVVYSAEGDVTSGTTGGADYVCLVLKICVPGPLTQVLVQSMNEAVEEAANADADVPGYQASSIEQLGTRSRLAKVSIAGLEAEVLASDSGQIAAQIEELPPGTEPPEGGEADDVGEGTTTETETGTVPTETAPTETGAPVEPAPSE